MAVILFFTVAGFLAGLVYVVIKRKINPGKIVAAASIGVLAAAAWKIFEKHIKKNSYNRYNRR